MSSTGESTTLARLVIICHTGKVAAEDGVVSSVLIFGLIDHPHDYATLLPELEAFVQRVRLR